MIRKYLLPLIAVIGVGIGLFAAVRSAQVTPAAAPVSAPPQAPFQAFVAGAGMVEANTENIAIGTQIAGIVSKIYVQIGSKVKAGDPLFLIDDRATRATLATQQAAVKVAEAQLATAQHDYARALDVPASGAVSVEETDQRRYTSQAAEAQLEEAKALVNQTATDLDRLTVRAPMDGQVLQLKIHLGEFAPTGVLAQPLILFGGVEPLNVRTDVDENDAWRVSPNARAVGYLLGNKKINTPAQVRPIRALCDSQGFADGENRRNGSTPASCRSSIASIARISPSLPDSRWTSISTPRDRISSGPEKEGLSARISTAASRRRPAPAPHRPRLPYSAVIYNDAMRR
ncbi:MAG: efflux RND transporter periplasmic adaptor subunit [Verrucomicrobiota bacterium]